LEFYGRIGTCASIASASGTCTFTRAGHSGQQLFLVNCGDGKRVFQERALQCDHTFIVACCVYGSTAQRCRVNENYRIT
jgi:hypothetical protein